MGQNEMQMILSRHGCHCGRRNGSLRASLFRSLVCYLSSRRCTLLSVAIWKDGSGKKES